ncbi:PREDICTED: ADP-ribosylation factor-like protein 15 [Acropora digitifera]|uniref:ADP-ribosylation factor-like protein 15 n=1 Tax=Acropora digitifera TaxID=70779 RepID=UPI00077A3E96|nr:PREDICTED: ADP-ribosylation factor-like protein 15 [Acropora digitifera]
MGEKCQWCCLFCAICRIGCFRCGQKLCCKQPSTPRPSYSVIAIGLSQSGKSVLFAKLSSEAIPDDLKPTVGFSSKAVQLPMAILNIKELGGQNFFPCYSNQVICFIQIFVVDSSSNDDDVKLAAAELQEALSHPSLKNLPLLVLANKQDVAGARSSDELSKIMGLEVIASNRNWHLQSCSKDDLKGAREGLVALVALICPEKTTDDNRL